MSTADDVKDTEIQVKLGDTVLGTATLDNTIGTAVYDAYGTAHVAVGLPAGTPTGPATLTLVGASTGTQVKVPITVEKATSTVTGSDVTVAYGRSTTTHVTVTADGLVPTGRVLLKSGGVTVGAGDLTDGATDATLYAKRLEPGTHEVTVSYAGDGSVKPGTDTITVTVTKAAATVIGTRTVVEYGKGTVVPVRVGASGVVPTGTVILKVDDLRIGSATLTDGMAGVVVAAKKLPIGTHTATITYSGDGFVNPGTGSVVIAVNKATPKVVGTRTVMSYGTASSMPVTVSATGLVPTGRVTLRVGDVLVGTGTLTDGTTTVVIGAKKFAPGTYTVDITYSGDGSVKTGTGTATLVVNKATPQVVGTDTTVSFTAAGSMQVTVSAPGVVPTGRVTLKVGDVVLGTGTLSNGVATAAIGRGRLPASETPYDVTISYSGDAFVKTGTGTAHLTVTP
jgi:5'-nucleotidase